MVRKIVVRHRAQAPHNFPTLIEKGGERLLIVLPDGHVELTATTLAG
jgi:hypothetical protein